MADTQHFIPIEDIRDDLVLLKNGGASLVISTSAVNFGLLFETEQISIIEAFAGMLNSLSFPIQIVILSKRLDVASYLTVLDGVMEKQANPLLKEMTARYRDFVESIIKENNVLDKQFYVCVNASAVELGMLSRSLEDKINKANTILGPRCDHLIRQLSRLGLKARQLSTVELVKLFYGIYNSPDTAVSPAVKVVKNPPKSRRLKRDLLEETSQSTTADSPLPPLPSQTDSSPETGSPTFDQTKTANDSPFVVEELNDEPES